MSTNQQHAVAAQLETFIRERFKVPADDRLFSRTVRLWDEGYVDSIGLAEMIAFLERTFGVTISNDVVFSPDFTHINGIAKLVIQLQMGSSCDASTLVLKAGTAA